MLKQWMITAGAILLILTMTTPAFAQCIGGPAGWGCGAPFGLGLCGFADPFSSVVGLGLSMIDSVLGATFSVITGLALGGCGFGIPFAGCGVPFGGCGFC